MEPQRAHGHGLVVSDDGRTPQPYWRHDTMSCSEVVEQARWLKRSMMEGRVALEGVLFFSNTLEWNRDDRSALLDFQYDLVSRHPVVSWLGDQTRGWVQRRLARDVGRALPAA